MQEESLLSTKPYEPMLNLFAAYADEEEAEVQMMESRPSPGRTASASRKRKGNEPEMFNLFSQENMYDEAFLTVLKNTILFAVVTGPGNRRQRKRNGRNADYGSRKNGKKKRNHVRLPEKYAPNTRTALS